MKITEHKILFKQLESVEESETLVNVLVHSKDQYEAANEIGTAYVALKKAVTSDEKNQAVAEMREALGGLQGAFEFLNDEAFDAAVAEVEKIIADNAQS